MNFVGNRVACKDMAFPMGWSAMLQIPPLPSFPSRTVRERTSEVDRLLMRYSTIVEPLPLTRHDALPPPSAPKSRLRRWPHVQVTGKTQPEKRVMDQLQVGPGAREEWGFQAWRNVLGTLQ